MTPGDETSPRARPGVVLVVTGTGTGIGKTLLTVAVVSFAQQHGRAPSSLVAGFKPVETGGVGDFGSDGARLRDASSFHVKHLLRPPFLLAPPISPHLAAREAGISISLAVICASVRALASVADLVVVELAGGLFTPLTDHLANIDLLRDLNPDKAILVAPDRLGVLHDVAAATRAAQAAGVRLHGVVLNPEANPDTSTGRNLQELRVVTDVPALGVLPRVDSPEDPRSLERHFAGPILSELLRF